jgi:hypothetical protein
MFIAIGVYVGRAVMGEYIPPALCFANTEWQLSNVAWSAVATPWDIC